MNERQTSMNEDPGHASYFSRCYLGLSDKY